MKEKKVKRELLIRDQVPPSFVSASITKNAAPEVERFDHFTVGDLVDDLPPLETIKADRPIREALRKMCAMKYSQLPVIQGKICIGAVTLESILTLLTKEDARGNVAQNFMDRPVRRFIDRNSRWAQPEDDLLKHVEWMAEKGFVIIGSRSNWKSLITNYDLVHFFKKRTEVFLLLREIETSLRYVVANILGKTRLKKALRILKKEGGSSPSCIEDLTFDELRQLIVGNWQRLECIFLDKQKVDSQLTKLRGLRNRIFHFRAEITAAELTSIWRLRDNYLGLAYRLAE